jgi:hypothetical protein
MKSKIYYNYTTSIKRRNVMYYANDIVTKPRVDYEVTSKPLKQMSGLWPSR